MAIGLYYSLEFKNVEDTLVKVLIGDTTVVADDPQIIALEPAGSPLIISTVDNEESKFTPIKGQQAEISFFSNGETSLQTFADGADDRFPVTIYYGTDIIFYGFLSLADNAEAFLPPRNVVTLTANDKLGALKEIALIDQAGENPQGKYKIGNLIAMCLLKTGLSLQIRVINNLRHGSGVVVVALAVFLSAGNQIDVGVSYGSYFYIGQILTVTGTASNNITFTVTGIISGSVLNIDQPLTDESAVNATFTDLTSADHIYKGTFLDAKTFEEEIGVSENCADVLSKILGFDCCVTQYKECWWIYRIDEYDSNLLYVSRFDENGNYLSSYTDSDLLKSIGFVQEHWLEGEATVVLPTRPVNFVKLTYNFKYWAELICNQDFSRGTGDPIVDTNPNQSIVLVPECWTFYRNFFDGATWIDGTPQAGAHGELVKRYEYGYEKDRYFLVEHEDVGGADDVHYLKSEGVDLREGDKINISFDFKLDADYGLTSLSPGHVTLVPYDGSDPWYWNLDTGVNEWVQRATITTNPFDVGQVFRWQGTRNDEWESVGAESLPLPASGKLYIRLAANFNIFVPYLFSNLQITYTPFVNGSYRAYTGRYEKVTRTETGYLAIVDDEVYISDAEGKLFKGALFFLYDSEYYLTSHWYDASKYALGNPDLDKVQPFGWHQAFAVWNQYRLANRIFQAQFQGLGSDIPSLVHKFSITDISDHSNNRFFLMLTCEKDLFNCNIKGTLEQVYHTTEGKDYESSHEFKYIS